MADRYTLPDLSGAEVEILPRPQGPRPDGRVDVCVVGTKDLVTLTLPSDMLTPVEPSLPPEPPQGSVRLDRYGQAWQRISEDGMWRCVHNIGPLTWPRLHTERGPLDTMVPAPGPDAPEHWPPQPGDIWQDRQGHRWTCVPPSAFGGHPDTRYLVRLDQKADDAAEEILRCWGPMTLVHRSDPRDEEPPF